ATDDNCVVTPPLAEVLSRYTNNLDSLLAFIPNRFVLQDDIRNNNSFEEGGANTYDIGNFISTDIEDNIQYSQDIITSSPAFGEEGAYFTSYRDGVWLLAADLDAVDLYLIDGLLGTNGNGTASGYTTTFTAADGTTYYALFKRVFGSNTPSVNHLILVPDVASATHDWQNNTNWDFHQMRNLSAASRIYHFNFYGDNNVDNGYKYTNAEVDTIVEAFVDLVAGAFNLPTVTLTEGLPNGARFPVGPTDVAYVVTDASGNTANCSFNVMVMDNSPPIIFNLVDSSNCPTNLVIDLDADGHLVIPDLINDLIAIDNCGATLSQLPASGTEIPNLEMGDTEVVTIRATDAVGNTNTESCTVTLTANVILPLDLLSFTGEARDKSNLLTWTTANAEDFSHFEVERSANGQGPWSVLAQPDLQASGEHEYIDETPLPSAYYRLKMIDLDGTFVSSNVVYLENQSGEDAGAMRVYPNPNTG
ncbi:MAG: HYR domain-containing protein, partial [Bacteroidota bacterium]